MKDLFRKKTIKRISSKINYLNRPDYNPANFLSLRLITSICVFGISSLIFKYWYIISPILTIIYYIGLEYFVFDMKIKKLSNKLDSEALHFFEVLSLTLDTKTTIQSALEITTDNVKGNLSNEFKKCLNEINLGKSLNQSLNDLRNKIPNDTVNNIILTIIQTNTNGTNLKNTLQEQINYMQDRRLLEVKKQINKLPIKISVVSVLIFIPLILLIILSPVIINLINK